MGIGGLMLDDKWENSFVGCSVDDTQSGCRIELRDNEHLPTEISLTLTTERCIELRNYLNRYIEAYVNTGADDE